MRITSGQDNEMGCYVYRWSDGRGARMWGVKVPS